MLISTLVQKHVSSPLRDDFRVIDDGLNMATPIAVSLKLESLDEDLREQEIVIPTCPNNDEIVLNEYESSTKLTSWRHRIWA